jgi:hypothetical protein
MVNIVFTSLASLVYAALVATHGRVTIPQARKVEIGVAGIVTVIC